MITQPKLEDRSEQHYLAIRTQAAIHELPTVIPQLHDEVLAWMRERGLAPSGAPFIRYHVINMAEKLDIALGWPTAGAVPGQGHIISDALPAGRYASLLYTGDYSGLMDANGSLIGWAVEQGIEWDAWDAEHGHAFGSRFETYITDPGDEPDPSKWETEVAIRVADR
jgi:effector-binding domain-containing protein